MKCPTCHNEMDESRDDHLFEESGLDSIILEGVPVYTCACGEKVVSFFKIPTLHTVIGRELIKKGSMLTGKEIRFLRKNMGFSAKRLAETMGVDQASVSRWENSSQKMSSSNDRMVRMLYCTMKGLDSRELVEEVFPDIATNAGITQFRFLLTGNQWKVAEELTV